MRFSRETNGSRRYKVSSDQEIISPKEGQDYTVTRVRSKLGILAYVTGTVYHPVEKQDTPLKVVNFNGFLASSKVYDGVSAEMAALGATTAAFDTWHPLTPKDLKDPLLVASMGGHAMIDIMEQISGEESEVAVVGHSMGALSSSRLAAFDNRVGYWVGDAPAGIQHDGMLQVHIDNIDDILSEEAIPLGKEIFETSDIKEVALEYAIRFGLNPSQVFRQAIILCSNPDIAPLLAKGKEHDVMTAVMLHELDKFFHRDIQLEVISHKPHLFDAVHAIDGTKHVHANMFPRENGIIRLDVIRQLQAKKAASKVLALASGN